MLGWALSCSALALEEKGVGEGLCGGTLPEFRPSDVVCRLRGRIVFESVRARSVSALTIQHLAVQAVLWRWPLIIP